MLSLLLSSKQQEYVMTTSEPGRRRTIVKVILALILVAALVAAIRLFDVQQIFRDALAWISGLGPLGPVIFVGLYILACVFLLPGAILTLGAGAVFGFAQGAVAASVGATLGATCAFLVGRYLARDWVAGRIAGNDRFRAVDEAVAREGWKIVLLTRLSPAFPFNILNYAFGLTKVRLKHYFFASWVGMIPGMFMYVYIGSLAGDLASLGAGNNERSLGEWIMYGVGLAATVVVTVFITRLAREALNKRIPTQGSQT
jgi:uncharacterized membrane protein YdjX (TVP38/TMEM64 family)